MKINNLGIAFYSNNYQKKYGLRMSQTYKLIGGARIGNANATYPFAELYADENILKIMLQSLEI